MTLATLPGLALALGVAIATPALAQTYPPPASPSSISATNKWGWGENIGWTDWNISGGMNAQGVALVPLANPTIMQGFIWGENVGWIFLGDGVPDAGTQYANTGVDFGVNISATNGRLSGFAWGENIGWIDFGAAAAIVPTPPAANIARYESDTTGNYLRGYVWGENVAWIHLNSAVGFIQNLCATDRDGNGVVNSTDVSTFINDWFTDLAKGTLFTDFDGNGVVNSTDVSAFINQWFVDTTSAACV